MDYFNNVVGYMSGLLSKAPKKQVPVAEMSRFDMYTNYFVRLISWDDPVLSWITFIICNFLYLVVMYLEVRVLCIIFLLCLVIFLLDAYCDKLEIKEHPRYISLRQIADTLKRGLRYIRRLKYENPTLFCGISMFGFGCLSWVGSLVSGDVLLYTLFLGTYFGFYFYRQTPKEYVDKVCECFNSVRNTDGVVAETELMPFISGKDFNGERDPDLDSLLTDKTQDSVSNSYTSGLTTMPSHLEADTFQDDLQEDDFIPAPFCTGANDTSSDSDSEQQKRLEFDSTHFNKDSSSSEDENYTKGLKFSDIADSKVGKGIYENLTAIGNNLLSNVIQSAASHAMSSSVMDCESDFVFVNKEDAEEEET